jgi:hypothetical protein
MEETMTTNPRDIVEFSAVLSRRLTYDPSQLADPPTFRSKFFEWLGEEGRVGCGVKGPGDPAVGIRSEDCTPHLEKIETESCGCAVARYWCRHGHSWVELQCKKHSLPTITEEMEQWNIRR